MFRNRMLVTSVGRHVRAGFDQWLGFGLGLRDHKGVGQTDQPRLRPQMCEDGIATGDTGRRWNYLLADLGQNSFGRTSARLLPFAGERVTASGKGYVRAGTHAIVLENIQAAEKAK